MDHLKIYPESEVEIRPTGEKEDLSDWLSDPNNVEYAKKWNNNPLFAVYTKGGERIYPRFEDPNRSYLGERDYECESWIEKYCSAPKDSFWFPNGGEYPIKCKPESIEIIPTGKIYKHLVYSAQPLPFSEPLFVIGIANKKILFEPQIGNKFRKSFDIQELEGVIEDDCRNWILQRRSRNPEDKPFRKDLLVKLTKFCTGVCLGDITVIENVRDDEHERHDDLHMILKQGDRYYRCDYIITETGLGVGRWWSYKGHIDGEWYLCERVYPHKKTVTEFSNAPRG